MECAGIESFGCLMNDMGGWTGNFFETVGSPAGTLLFIVLTVAFIALIFIGVRKIISD